MAKSQKRWLHNQQRDQFVKQARQSKYRSRAVYKLIEIDRRDKLFQPDQVVLDLGAAPGSWSQYAGERVGTHGTVIAVDLLPMEPIPHITFIQGDFTEPGTHKLCLQSLAGKNVDLVISDMAPNLTGIRATDQARSMTLVECTYDSACQVLKPGGSMLVKVFQGQGIDQFKQQLMENFQKVVVRKPRASRNSSREFYILAKDYVV